MSSYSDVDRGFLTWVDHSPYKNTMLESPTHPTKPQQQQRPEADEQALRAWARSLNPTPERLRDAMREGSEHADNVRELINMK